MRLLILFVSIWVLASAKPGTYREKEDFEYSRSSSDDGSKSGYYGAQRGNMGGNYEHAHNMDNLAQHQMSTLVRQVDGELGTAANTRTGSVFTAGNSRGVFGSGNYDLTNLKGRNFDESNAFGSSRSHSSMSSNSGSDSSLGYGYQQALSNAQYSSSQSQSARQSSGFQSTGQSSSDLLIGGQQAEILHSDLQSEYDNQAANNNYKYYSQGSNLRNSGYEDNLRDLNGYNSNTRIRYISGNPVKVYIKPGTTVTIPVSAQTYDASHFNALHDQNSINSDAEILSSSGRGVHVNPKTKHYESSYKYKKEWETHDTQTIATPTDNPFPQNSEFYDNTQLRQDSKYQGNLDINRHSSAQLNKINSAYSNGYNAGTKSSSSHQSRYQSGLTAESQNSEAALVGSHSKDLLGDGHSTGNIVENINSRPKHYQSSYSYHKAWERQGDPYVIEPVSSGSGSNLQTSQSLTAASENYGHASSHQHGSRYSQSQKSYSSDGSLDCDEHGRIRVARSYNTDQEPSVYQNNFEQQNQNDWASTEDLGQQTQNKWDNLENLGQQTQDNWDHLDNLSQQQQNEWENQQELGQQSQNTWELEKLSQYPQRNLDTIEDLGQQIENKNDKQNVEQIPQNTWDKLEDLGQKLNGKSEKHVDLQKESQSTQSKQENLGQQPQDIWGKLDNFDQGHNGLNKDNFGQQTQSQWDHFENFQNIGQKDQNQWFNLHDIINQQTQNWKNLQNINQQNWENGQVESHYNSNGVHHLHSQDEKLFGQSNDDRHHLQEETSISNTHYTSWNSHAQENENKKYKEFSDFWNTDRNYWQHGLNLDSQQQTPETNDDKNTIHNLWDKLEKIYNNSQTESNNAYEYSVNNKISETTEQGSNTEGDIIPQRESKNTHDITNTGKEKEDSNVREIHIVQPMDIGRGDISSEDLTNEYISADQHKNNNILVDSVYKKTTEKNEFHSLHKNENSTESHDQTTTEVSIISVLNLNQNIQSESKHYKSSSTLKEDSTTEIINHFQHPHMIASNFEQMSENFGQQTMDQQLEDFGQQNLDQQLENFGQQLEDFRQPNMDQQLEGFGQQNMDQQVEDLRQPIVDQQLEDFGQQSMGHNLEDFSQQNMDQQLEDLGQMNQVLQSQTLDNFKEPQQMSQKIKNNEELQKFGQTYEFEFNHATDHNHNEDFGQQQQNSWVPEENVEKLIERVVEKPKDRSPELVVPEEPVTEKSGFWTSVGNKLTGAKNTVAGWFKRS